MSKKAVAYARISFDRKLGTQEEGLGVERQLFEIREYARKHDFIIEKEYVDNNASATSGKKRPAFEQLLQDAPDNVIVFDMDRLLRTSTDLEKVLKADLTIHQCTASTLDLSTPQNRMLARIITSYSSFEGEHKSERQKAKNAQLARDGVYRGSKECFTNERTGELKEAGLYLRELARSYIEGNTTIYGMAKALNEAGYLTTAGNHWVNSTLRRVIDNPVMKGYQEYKGELYKLKNWEAVLTEEEYEMLHDRIHDRPPFKKTGRWLNKPTLSLLSGILFCGKCGSKMATSYTSKSRGQKRVYKCRSSQHIAIRAEPLETLIIIYIHSIVYSVEKEDKSKADYKTTRYSELTAKAVALEKHIEDWEWEAIQAEISPKAIARRKKEMFVELDRLRAERNVLRTQPVIQLYHGKFNEEDPTLENVENTFRSMGIPAQRETVMSFINRIDVMPPENRKAFELHTIGSRIEVEFGEKVLGSMVATASDLFFDLTGKDSPLTKFSITAEEKGL